MTEWNIQSRGHACGACSKAFTDKQPYHTLLFDEKSEFRRMDICQECWEAQYSQGARERKGFVSYWHGVYEAPQPRPEPIQKENAESLLRKLIEINDPQYIPASYILAVMLERKRLLKVKDQIVREGKRFFVYEQSGTGDMFTIMDPDLHLNELEAVQRDVGVLLEHGLGNPGAPPAAAQAETPSESRANEPAPGDPSPETQSLETGMAPS